MKKSDTCEFKIKTEPSAEKGRVVFPILMAISFGHFLNDLIQSVIPSVYPIFKEEYGFSFLQIGIITLVVQMTSSILQPVVGSYTDRHPHPYSLSVGMLFTLAGILLLAFADSFGLILFSVAIVGLGSAIFHPESSRIAQLSAGDKKGLGQSVFQVGGQRRECGRSAFGCYNHNPVRTEVDSMVCHRRSARVFGIVSCRTMV